MTYLAEARIYQESYLGYQHALLVDRHGREDTEQGGPLTRASNAPRLAYMATFIMYSGSSASDRSVPRM